MAEFCEGCPMRGRMTGEVYGLAHDEIVTKLVRTGGIRIGPPERPIITNRRQAGVLVDDEMNPSLPIWLGVLYDLDSIEKKLDNCEGPFVTEERRLFGKPKQEFFCPAIGRLAIDPSDQAYRIIAKQLNL